MMIVSPRAASRDMSSSTCRDSWMPSAAVGAPVETA